MAEIVPTRGAALALAEERRFLEAGYEFLDEKRMLLASTLLTELDGWRGARAAYDGAMEAAVAALKRAIAWHGVESFALYPTDTNRPIGFSFAARNFLGLELLELTDPTWAPRGPLDALDASHAAEACRLAFAELVPLAVELAVHAQNIQRLIRDYRATERRARALQNVLIPETVATLAMTTEFLEEGDQEEALRIRNARR